MKKFRVLSKTVMVFALQMLDKLNMKQSRGWHGWGDKTLKGQFKKDLLKHVEKGDWVDVANYAMFLWNLENDA